MAFSNIENGIYAKANEQVTNLTAEDSSEGEEVCQNEDVNSEFDLDDDINLDSPLLNNMLSDTKPRYCWGLHVHHHTQRNHLSRTN